jgi:hypothetical protein
VRTIGEQHVHRRSGLDPVGERLAPAYSAAVMDVPHALSPSDGRGSGDGPASQ